MTRFRLLRRVIARLKGRYIRQPARNGGERADRRRLPDSGRSRLRGFRCRAGPWTAIERAHGAPVEDDGEPRVRHEEQGEDDCGEYNFLFVRVSHCSPTYPLGPPSLSAEREGGGEQVLFCEAKAR